MSEKREETAMLWSFRGYRLLLLMGLLFFLTSGQAGGREPSFLLKVTLNGEGTVTSNPPGIKCTTGNRGTCQKTFREGTQVTLTAAPASSWQFTTWAGCDSVNGNQCTLTMSASKTCTATFNITWAKVYDWRGSGHPTSIQQTSDGGYIVAGYNGSFGAGYYDVWVLKLNGRGDVVWQKIYGGRYDDYPSSIQQTSDGGYIVAGYNGSFGAGYYDVWVLKLNGRGDVVWQKTYGGEDDDEAFSIQQTSDGGYIVAGYTQAFGAGLDDFWVLKLDSSGHIQWQKTYGGENDDEARSIQQTSDGGYILAGRTRSFGAGLDDFWVLKLDASGDVVWQKTYGGKKWDEASSIQQTSDGGYIVAGRTRSFGAGGDFWVLKLDASGNVQWQKTYGGEDDDEAFSIQQTSDGGYIVAGDTSSFGAGGDFWVLKLTPSGDVANCTPFNLAQNSNGISASTSVTPSASGTTPTTSLATMSNTNVAGQDSAATSATQCTG
jgi:uncharacterized delta-60 repeat protein